MQILLCAATDFEIRPTVDMIRKQKLKQIDILITGVGVMASSYHITKAVCTQRPTFLLQAGLGGMLNHDLALGKVVVVKNEVLGDLGVEENQKFLSLFDLKLQDKDIFPWSNGKLCNHSPLLNQLHLPVVNGVTVNEISTNPERIHYYKKHLDAGIESMEGASLHYVGLLQNLSFLQIRSLSNFAGERDKSKWLLKEAIHNLNDELEKILSKLINE